MEAFLHPPQDSSNNRENAATNEVPIATYSSPFYKEEMEIQQKMLQATVQVALNSVGTSTETMAQQGKFFITLSANKTRYKTRDC